MVHQQKLVRFIGDMPNFLGLIWEQKHGVLLGNIVKAVELGQIALSPGNLMSSIITISAPLIQNVV